MRQGLKPKNHKTILIFIFLILSTQFLISNEEIKIFKEPKYTTEEKNYSELLKIDELMENINDNSFLVKPSSLVSDSNGNIYVYDSRQSKILKYSKCLKFLKAYGKKGKGPGDFGAFGVGMTRINLYLGDDNLIYAGDRYNKRIHCFDLDFNLINDFKIDTKTSPYIIPVTNGRGIFLIYSDSGGLVDIFDTKTGKIKTLLDRRELKYGLFYNVEKPNDIYYYKPGPTNIHYDLVGNNKIIIFSSTSGFLYILENYKLTKKLKIWPKKALETYKKELRETIQGKGFMPYFPKLFTDKDDKRFFYLYFGQPSGTDKTLIYKFDLEGNLIIVLYIKERFKYGYTKPMYKKNGLFYTIGLNDDTEETIIIYKEDKK